MNAFRPLIREASIFYYAWALHDLQKKNPGHPDLPYVVHRLRDLRAERACDDNSIVRRAVRWL